MNTVSHPDGTSFSCTGRHLAGGRSPAASIDVAMTNELGTAQLLPDVAIGFPAAYVGEHLDRRAIPLRVANAGTIAKSLARSDAYLKDDDRAAITALLTDEAHDLAGHSVYPETFERLASQDASAAAPARQRAQDRVHAAGAAGRVSDARLQGEEHRRRRARRGVRDRGDEAQPDPLRRLLARRARHAQPELQAARAHAAGAVRHDRDAREAARRDAASDAARLEARPSTRTSSCSRISAARRRSTSPAVAITIRTTRRS